MTAAICKGLEEHELCAVIGYRRPNHKPGYFYKREYLYDAEADEYRCPAGQRITYNTTNRLSYRQYHSDPGTCKRCSLRMRCTWLWMDWKTIRCCKFTGIPSLIASLQANSKDERSLPTPLHLWQSRGLRQAVPQMWQLSVSMQVS